MASWLRRPIRGVLMDITGVLYDSGERKGIEGSADALKMLRMADIPFRFITNETQKTKEQLDSVLHRLGFDIYEKEIFMCVPAAKKFIHDLNYRPFLLVHPNVEAEFAECDKSQPNCVVVGDAGSNFSYENLNRAFHVLVDNNDSVLITLGKGKYYKEHDKMVMDVGAFTAALEYATERQAIVIGKPGEEFFRMALEDMKLRPEDVVMIGDDIVCDVGGAQSTGMRGVLVRTGKFRPSDEDHPSVKPDAIVHNLMEAVRRILSTDRPRKTVLPQ
ncbi:phospholysine phosphohistidine inorganic pyrophosphate phosphatase-like [Dermacentor variabilis]|uniref:phospholysine phosphohistidine inorganic pyrophosphate phosphatase-like n=1 Tax=Dermacentor variabilis TaxID=34621 RepID=UPI003F5BA2C5